MGIMNECGGERQSGGGFINGDNLLDGTYLIRVYPEQFLQVFNGSKNVGRQKGNTSVIESGG